MPAYGGLAGGTQILRLVKRLDVREAGEIELGFSGPCAAERGRILVDMGGADFISSIGIRMLVSNAKALAVPAGKIVLLNPPAQVSSILIVLGTASMVPMYDGLECATTLLHTG